MDSITLKKEIRKTAKSTRLSLSKAEIQEASDAIFAQWLARFSDTPMDYLHLFLTIKKFNEIDTQPFLEWVMATKNDVKPVVPITLLGEGQLKHLVLDKEFELKENSWGIPEPNPRKTYISPPKIDMVLVPMLAFDDNLNRIGYGKGFYDGFLAATRPDCLKIGLCLEAGHQSQAIPAEAHDVPLDFVITEKQIFGRK